MTQHLATEALEAYIADLLADDLPKANSAGQIEPSTGLADTPLTTELNREFFPPASEVAEPSSPEVTVNKSAPIKQNSNIIATPLPEEVAGKHSGDNPDSLRFGALGHEHSDETGRAAWEGSNTANSAEKMSVEKTAAIQVRVSQAPAAQPDPAEPVGNSLSARSRDSGAESQHPFHPGSSEESSQMAAVQASPSFQDIQPEQDSAPLAELKRQKLQDMLNRKTAEILTVKPAVATESLVESAKPLDISALKAEPSPAPVDVPVGASELELGFKEALPSLLAWGDNGRPVWAENRFDVLLFDVSGLSLAVPLVALGQIIPMSDKLTFLQGQSDWFMGILPSSAGDIRTVNTALFVMPERYQKSFLDSAKYVVTIDGLRWGLAVDNVKQPVSIDPDDVKWRSSRSQRPWLAGTVKSHMCALIDIPQMGELLNRADKNYHAKA